MRKIPTVFVRDPANMARVLPEVHPDCGWVLAGEGLATRKYDGTCVMLDDHGDWWARREVKKGKQPPPNFQEVEHDPVTGKSVGWEPIGQSSFARWHAEALEPFTQFGTLIGRPVPLPGTYELIGPKINGNPERVERHRLESHANACQIDIDAQCLTYDDLRDIVLEAADDGWEGIVWHHPDGRMAKLKARDFR